MARASVHGSMIHHFLVDAAVSSTMWMASDAIAQTVEIKCGMFPAKKDPSLAVDNKNGDDPDELKNGDASVAAAQGVDVAMPQDDGQKWDFWRTTRFGIVGIPSGIWLHAWFRLLDSWFPTKTLGKVVCMAALDWLGECPYILSNMSMNAFLENGSCAQVQKTLRNDYCACNTWNLIFWFPADILMFYYIPVKYQLLCVRMSDLVFLPVDSYFANRSIQKPGVGDGEDEEAEKPADGEGAAEGAEGAEEGTLPDSKPREGGACGCAIM